jgi:mono/diheme cytochrome c family protein
MTRRGRRLVVLLLLLAATTAAGCGADDRADTKTAERGPDTRVMRAGAQVFAEHCQTCHPLLGRPNTEVHTDFPPGLDLDQVSPSPAFARRMVESGGVAMGSFSGTLSAAQQRAVVVYVLEVGGSEVAPPANVDAADLAHGRAVYEEHCQACHAIDDRPATRPNPIWAGTDFDELRPGVLHVERIVREGQFEAMPSFRDRLTLNEIRAVALYVNATARGGVSRAVP